MYLKRLKEARHVLRCLGEGPDLKTLSARMAIFPKTRSQDKKQMKLINYLGYCYPLPLFPSWLSGNENG